MYVMPPLPWMMTLPWVLQDSSVPAMASGICLTAPNPLAGPASEIPNGIPQTWALIPFRQFSTARQDFNHVLRARNSDRSVAVTRASDRHCLPGARRELVCGLLMWLVRTTADPESAGVPGRVDARRPR